MNSINELSFLEELKDLLNQDRDYYKVDLHIHSIYSQDGEDTVESIISRASEYGFDIISISDHDEVQAHTYLSSADVDKQGICIIPGIEISTYNEAYGSMFHVLQYGFSVGDHSIQQIVYHNHQAEKSRFKKQCQLLVANPLFRVLSSATPKELEKEIMLLNNSERIPDYIDFVEYLYKLAVEQSATIEDILDIYKESIAIDTCKERRSKNMDNYSWISSRIKERPYEPARMIKKIIANPLTEDSNYAAEPIGNISISNYGQITLDKIKDCFVTVLAHPEYRKALQLNQQERKRFDFLENNFSNKRITDDEFGKLKEIYALPVTVGSDFHYTKQGYYHESDFYLMSKPQLYTFYEALYQKANI